MRVVRFVTLILRVRLALVKVLLYLLDELVLTNIVIFLVALLLYLTGALCFIRWCFVAGFFGSGADWSVWLKKGSAGFLALFFTINFTFRFCKGRGSLVRNCGILTKGECFLFL